jgi:GNAT superfamily N-acetyltransferase
MPTFTARSGTSLCGFLTLKRHFAESAEVHCIAVHASKRGRGVGRTLLAAAEAWLADDGARLLQVKTLGPSHPSTHYAETRRFYERAGFVALEEFQTLWGHNPCLQLAKVLPGV